MAYPGFRHQLDTLIDRELALLTGAGGTLLLLMTQPPLIGYFIGLAWDGEEAVPATFFIMSVAAVWMGCMNACSAIVRERPVFERERLAHLHLGSYLLAKTCVLSALGFVQILLLLLVQGRMMRLSGGWSVHLGLFITLWLTLVTATTLGLLISACTRTVYAAVVAVPILLIPQIIFSELLLKENIDKRLPDLIEDVTITKWSFDALRTIGESDWEWNLIFRALAVLPLGAAALLAIAALKLHWDSDR